jgi:hypothetical protein
MKKYLLLPICVATSRAIRAVLSWEQIKSKRIRQNLHSCLLVVDFLYEVLMPMPDVVPPKDTDTRERRCRENH